MFVSWENLRWMKKKFESHYFIDTSDSNHSTIKPQWISHSTIRHITMKITHTHTKIQKHVSSLDLNPKTANLGLSSEREWGEKWVEGLECWVEHSNMSFKVFQALNQVLQRRYSQTSTQPAKPVVSFAHSLALVTILPPNL